MDLADDRGNVASRPKDSKAGGNVMRFATRHCPYCDSTEVRRSRFQSQEEVDEHVFTSPYRCDACYGRFFVLSRKTRYAIIAAVVFLIASIAIALIPAREPGSAVLIQRTAADGVLVGSA